MEQPHYTLPGVMNFLRTEWQRKEQTQIEWEIERADMRSRIARLETEKLELQRERDRARRHLEILYGQKLSKVQASPPTNKTPNGDDNSNEPGSEPQDASSMSDFNNYTESSQEASDELLKTVNESQEYLRQCVADIRHILRQTTIGDEAERVVALQPDLFSRTVVTLANFGSAALTVAALPYGRVVAGTTDGDLLVWDKGINEPRRFGEYKDVPVNCMQYSASNDCIIAGVGSVLYIFNNREVPEFVTSHKFDDVPIVRISIAPAGNLLAVVQANGVSSVWSLQEGRELIKMSEPATGVRVCDFAEVNGDLHLVLARNSDPTDNDSPEGNLLLADPLTGQLLKKIVFSFSAGISAILLTQDVIVLGTDSGDLRVFGLARGETLAEVTAAHRGEITSLNMIKDQTIVSTSVDGRVSLWSIPTLLWSGRMFSHDSGYGALCSATSDDAAVVGGGDGIIRVYRR